MRLTIIFLSGGIGVLSDFLRAKFSQLFEVLQHCDLLIYDVKLGANLLQHLNDDLFESILGREMRVELSSRYGDEIIVSRETDILGLLLTLHCDKIFIHQRDRILDRTLQRQLVFRSLLI